MKKQLLFLLLYSCSVFPMELTQASVQREQNASETDVAVEQESLLLQLPQEMLQKIVLLLVAQSNYNSLKDLDSVISLACTCKKMAATVSDKCVQALYVEQKPLLNELQQLIKDRMHQVLGEIQEKLRGYHVFRSLSNDNNEWTIESCQIALRYILGFKIANLYKRIPALIELGADPNKKDIKGSSALTKSISLESAWNKPFRLIIDSNVFITDENIENTLLQVITTDECPAAYSGEFDCLIKMRGKRFRCDYEDDFLQWDIKYNSGKNVELLIELGASPNSISYEDHPLVLATRDKNLEVIQYLLSKGADANICGKYGERLLFETGDTRIRELLIPLTCEVSNAQANILLDEGLDQCSEIIIQFALTQGGKISHYGGAIKALQNIKKNPNQFKLLLKYETDFKSALEWAEVYLHQANENINRLVGEKFFKQQELVSLYKKAITDIKEKMVPIPSKKGPDKQQSKIKKLWAKIKYRDKNNNNN